MTDMISAAHITSAADLINAYMSGGFLFDFVTVVAANIVLSGDNAVVIALAACSLPAGRRLQGIVFGTIATLVMRVVATYCAALLLTIPCMKLCGGLLILCIAVKLLLDKDSEKEEKETSGGLLRVIGVILLADLVMSVDNVLVVAGASKGNPALLFLGLGLSIPIIALGSSVISRLMGRYPVIVYIGAAILGKVAGEMILTDPLTQRMMHAPGAAMQYGAQIVLALAVVGAGILWVKVREPRQRSIPEGDRNGEPFYVAGWDIR